MRRATGYAFKIFYISQNQEWSELLGQIPGVQIANVQSLDALSTYLLLDTPDLVLLESSVEWADPISIIEKLRQTVTAPMVLLCNSQNLVDDPTLLKKAYAAGVCDALFSPINHDELLETVDVLLKFQRQASDR